jgi:hypothetical protein
LQLARQKQLKGNNVTLLGIVSSLVAPASGPPGIIEGTFDGCRQDRVLGTAKVVNSACVLLGGQVASIGSGNKVIQLLRHNMIGIRAIPPYNIRYLVFIPFFIGAPPLCPFVSVALYSFPLAPPPVLLPSG